MAQAPGRHSIPKVGTPHRRQAAEARGGSSSRGYDRRWERFRASFLARNPLCAYCLAAGRIVSATVVDHDLPHRGDPHLFWENTFTALCGPCHGGPKARAEAKMNGPDLLAWVRKRKATSPSPKATS